jgi:hypothetical protein
LEGNVKASVIAALVADVKFFVDLPLGYLFHKVLSFRDYPIENIGDIMKVPYKKGAVLVKEAREIWVGNMIHLGRRSVFPLGWGVLYT